MTPLSSAPPVPGNAFPLSPDVIDRVTNLVPGSVGHDLRHRRQKVASATQGSYDSIFEPAITDLSVAERLLCALHACRLTPSPQLAAHYRSQALKENIPHDLTEIVALGSADDVGDARLRAMLVFTRTLVQKPIDGDREALAKLTAVGLETPAVVLLAQLIAFISYQTRLAAGLLAMASRETSA